jgi:hypothetical protein
MLRTPAIVKIFIDLAYGIFWRREDYPRGYTCNMTLFWADVVLIASSHSI